MVKSAAKLEKHMAFVVGLADEYSAGFVDDAHSHEKAQLLYAASGVMSVITPDSNFIVPPQRGVWIPSGVQHEVSCRGSVSLRTLYIDPSFRSEVRECRIVEVGPLLQSLIVEITRLDPDEANQPRNRQIIDLLLSELSAAPHIHYAAPMPKDERLIRVCRTVIADPAGHQNIDDFADIACMSRRSFTRKFKSETGMGVAVWRQQVRLLEALSLLSTGATVTSAALDVGYESASAFSTTFQKAFGVAPSKYPF